MELHIIPLAGEPGKFIIYRPLAHLAFVGNRAMANLARRVAEGAAGGGTAIGAGAAVRAGAVAPARPAAAAETAGREGPALDFLASIGFLRPDPPPPPAPGPDFRPTTAVLLMTNACQFRCTYCYASAGEAPSERLTAAQGAAATDFVCGAALARGRPRFDVSFHGGGEPTLAWSVLKSCVAHARGKPLGAHIGLTSNGAWSPAQTEYVLANLDDLTLSFDGAPATQNARRPFATGRPSAEIVLRTIAALDRHGFPYAIRMTATAPWERFPEDVRFICEQTGCRTIQVEPAFNIERRGHPQGDEAACRGFSDAFLDAVEIAAAAGRTLLYSGARLGLVTGTFCTAPYNALIVTPAGNLVACYEVTDRAHPLAGLSTIGSYDGDGFQLDLVARGRLHGLMAARQAGCRDCFCLRTCAGDCYTRAFGSGPDGHLDYGPRCEMNRTITAGLLLHAIAAGDGVWQGCGGAAPQRIAAPVEAAVRPVAGRRTARGRAADSPLVVISWWSNTVGLACLHRLAGSARRRPVYAVQAGKSEAQMARFRALLPTGVVELAYPEELPADDSRIRETVALSLLREWPGAWFIDHDAFFHEDPEPWFRSADAWLGAGDFCLAIGEPPWGPAITQPAYWLSPARWPPGLSSFDPVPFAPKDFVRRPDLTRTGGDLVQPLKDTLVQAYEELAAAGLAGWFPLTAEVAAGHALPPFPSHTHLGGLFLYAGPVLGPAHRSWMAGVVAGFDRFFAGCPAEWLAAEDPELLRRHAEFKAAVGGDTPGARVPARRSAPSA